MSVGINGTPKRRQDLNPEIDAYIFPNNSNLVIADHHNTTDKDEVASAVNILDDYSKLNLRDWIAADVYGVAKTYQPNEGCIYNNIIYQNQSGGTLTGTSVPGVAPTSDWFPLTGGGSPTFDIPFWNGNGVVQGINTGTGAYANTSIVRAENGLYQSNNAPSPSTNFLTELAAAQWTFMGSFILISQADFIARKAASQLTANRYYAMSSGSGLGVVVRAMALNDYDKNGVLFADYTAGGLRGGTEWERCVYDVDNDVILERQDNYGNIARQTSTDVNGSGNPANCVDNAPWGLATFTGNLLDNCILPVYTIANITSYANNQLSNFVVDHAVQGVGSTFDYNIGATGTFTISNTCTTFKGNEAKNGGRVIGSVPAVINATSDGEGCVNTNGDYNFVKGQLNTVLAASRGCVVVGTSCSTTGGINSITVGQQLVNNAPGGALFGSGGFLGANAAYSFGIGVSGRALSYLSSVRGDSANATIENEHATGWTSLNAGVSQNSGTLIVGATYTIFSYNAGDDFVAVGGLNVTGTVFVATGSVPTTWTFGSTLLSTDARINGAILKNSDISLGTKTVGAVTAPLYPVNGRAGLLTIPASYMWNFDLSMTATSSVGDMATWSAKGNCWNNAGVITFLGGFAGNALWLDNAGAYQAAVTRMFTSGFAPTIALASGAANNLLINVTGVAAKNINWSGELNIRQNRTI